MRAARVSVLDGPAAVTVDEVDEPVLEPGHVLVDVHEAGVSFPDVLLTRGLYQMKPDLPFVPGAECAGVVRAAAEGSRFQPGDRVAAFPILGAFAETVAVPESLVFPLPDSVSFTTGAALLMNYLTVHFALVRRGRLEPGETVLVHGAAGGIGTAAIQLARALDAQVIAVVSSEAKRAVAQQAGAHHVVLADGFLAAVKELTGGRGVDVVVDPVGGDRFTDSLRSLAPEGRILVIGFTAGSIPEVKVNRLLLGNISVVGVAWGAMWHGEPGYLQEQWEAITPLLESGAIDPPIGRTHPLSDVAAAIAEIDERRATGKVTVRVR
ncbi:NADPH:quinone oxidoreductase family protein [Intrasporangium calvum]|uniref:NADPH:quinone oxidoreductase family protein n=1 Tax=Intrasporangium calvum TaxID=53358 RepID=A0ABT5GD67_9MICO|nr:NADPH:quinone oxidoreductase family protein [Intrasporangium calvum]MDC5696093.1 NADPH:quinone oxidoreductase family protein [Intrasporangium calvum]